ncbi:MAG TPA: ABC transporter permease, partial [Hyphomonas sp.]|nr:ABC transporter permease [Hyphomonas sp.]
MTDSKSISSFRWFHEINPIRIGVRLLAHRELIWQMARREVGQRYRGSYLGMLWTLITPIAMLLVYTFVFSLVFRSRWQADVETPPGEFALILFSGLAAFNFLSEVINRAPTLILSNPNFVKKVVFPLEILPVVAIVSALVNSLISVALVVIGGILVLGHVSSTILLLPLAYVPLILMVIGLAWFLSALGVYVRDIGPGISIVVQMLFFVSPIFFPVSAAPEWIRPAYALNP